MGRKTRARHTAVFFLSCAALWGQSVSITTMSAPDGSSGSILLKLDAPAGKTPVALQWDFVFPASIAVDPSDLIAGSAAEAAEKTLTCAAGAGKQAGGETLYRCILYGGQKPIFGGVIVTVHYRARNKPKNSDKVKAQNVLGTALDIKPIPIAGAEAPLMPK